MNIEEPSSTRGTAWLRLGFRPFFLAAGVFAVASMLVWFAWFALGWQFPFAAIDPIQWHGHEMIYGYAMAVISGFLLTAVGNWTGLQTLRGLPLLVLFGCWLLARLLLLAGTAPLLPAAALLDLLFGAGVIAAIAVPIVRARQWGNLAIVAKVVLLVASNLVFYLGVAGELQQGMFLGLYSGLYLVLALVLTMSRRVLPFFIERGVDQPVQLRNSKWIDIAGLVLFLGFWIADLMRPNGLPVTLFAIALAVLHTARLWGWHTAGLWRKPLLWSLYLAYASIIAGFVLKASVYYGDLSPYLAVHAFAVGGIALMTLGMMARVALGHTGRNVFEPPPLLFWVLAALVAALIARVLLPLFAVEQYRLWVILSQGLWVLAFLAFAVIYFPILTRPRVDGKDG